MTDVPIRRAFRVRDSGPRPLLIRGRVIPSGCGGLFRHSPHRRSVPMTIGDDVSAQLERTVPGRTDDGAEAYDRLVARNRAAAMKLALHYAGTQRGAERLVTDALTRVHAGQRPTDPSESEAKAQLFAAIRTIAIACHVPATASAGTAVEDAFLSLPPRTQRALWYVEV